MTTTDTVLNSPVRRFWRTVTVVGLAALVIGLTAPNVFIFSGADKLILRVNLGRDWTVTKAYSPADAWLQVGDRIDPTSLTPEDRAALNARFVFAGQQMHFTVERAGHRKAISIRVPSNPAAGASVVIWVKRLTASIFIIVGALLVLMRPCRMTWGFFLFALGNTNGNPYIVQVIWPAIYSVAWSIFAPVSSGLSFAGLWIFAARFPNDSPSGWRSQID